MAYQLRDELAENLSVLLRRRLLVVEIPCAGCYDDYF